MKMRNEYIHYSSEYGIGRMEFYHDRANALTASMLRELTRFMHATAEDPDIQVVQIQSGGDGAFSGGASLDDLQECTTEETATEFFMGFARLILAIRQCPKPVLVRVHGKAVGGSLGIVAAADMAFATTASHIRLSELSLGIGPFVIGPALERKLGVSAFTGLTYLSSIWQDAIWAKQKGLFTEVYTTAEELDAQMTERLMEMQFYNKEALISIKKMIWQQTPDWEQQLAERAALSAKLWVQKKTR